MEISTKQVNRQIEEFQLTGKQPSVLEIGYKTYAKLMNENKFANVLKKDPTNPLLRFYKGIKIKVVTEKHYFEIK